MTDKTMEALALVELKRTVRCYVSMKTGRVSFKLPNTAQWVVMDGATDLTEDAPEETTR